MAEVEWESSHKRILVRGLPDEDAVEVLAEKLHDLIVGRHINGVSGIVNMSTDDKALLVVELRRDAEAQAVVDEIRKHVSG
jgi:DNA gyrase/topoisomerase IV subunit A